MEKLKPCPVPECKGGLVVDKRHFQRSLIFTVRCLRCGATGPECMGRIGRAEAIERWNYRPQSEIERLAREVIKQWSAFMKSGTEWDSPESRRSIDAIDDLYDDLYAAVKEADRER